MRFITTIACLATGIATALAGAVLESGYPVSTNPARVFFRRDDEDLSGTYDCKGSGNCYWANMEKVCDDAINSLDKTRLYSAGG